MLEEQEQDYEKICSYYDSVISSEKSEERRITLLMKYLEDSNFNAKYVYSLLKYKSEKLDISKRNQSQAILLSGLIGGGIVAVVLSNIFVAMGILGGTCAINVLFYFWNRTRVIKLKEISAIQMDLLTILINAK